MRYVGLLTALGLILAVTGTAGAVTLVRPNVGPLAFDVTHREMGDTYLGSSGVGVYGPGGAFALPSTVGVDYFPGLGNMPGESAWGVVRVNTIMEADVAVNHTSIIEDDSVAGRLWNGADGKELVGIFWNIQDIGFDQGAVVQSFESTGLKLAIYEQPVGTFDTFQASAGFGQGSAGRIGASAYLGIGFGADGYPGVAGVDDDGINGIDDPGERGLGDDGTSTLWASGESVPGFVGALWTGTIDDGPVDAEVTSSYNINVAIGAIAGNAAFNWEITGGTLDGLPKIESEPEDNALGTNYGTGGTGPDNLGWFWGAGTFADVDAEFVTRSNNPFNTPGGGAGSIGDWTVTSSDVNTLYSVPEPVTMLGVLMGVGGLAGYLRRRLF